MDVARKVMILARECGLQLDMSTLSVSSLVPEPLVNGSVQEYINRLPEVSEPPVS
jgi:aspartokinase/homoserine dehydrogenase 1